jgi:hypothetical protein
MASPQAFQFPKTHERTFTKKMNVTNFKQEKHNKNANPKGWNEKGKNTKNLKSYLTLGEPSPTLVPW